MNEEKSKFLSIASHDLKNPINAIMGLTSLLKEENENFNQEQKDYLNYIEESSQKMTSLINYLLDISKIELGNQTLRLEEVDITLITESIIYTYQQSAKKKGFKIIFKSDFRGKTLVTDKHRISQLLDNLYSNAIKYGRPGGIIQVTWEDKGLYCRLEIFNEGEGIKEDELPLLFGKFQKLSTRPTGGESSSGLGLSITKQYVEELEGTIRCVSELSKGTSFIVELPK
jgi:signal transduction histidine kinase